MSYLFVVPTIMGRPQLEISNVEKLATEFPDSRILFVSNVEDEDFSNYIPTKNNIIKKVSNKKYSISKALNLGINSLEEDYFVFVQSDVLINKPAINFFTEIHQTYPNVGVIGIQQHSNFNKFHKQIPHPNASMFNVLWTDAVMFIHKNVINKLGPFNEDYLGDKESQEYCYRAIEEGYQNILIQKHQDKQIQWSHTSTAFESKIKHNPQEYLKVKNYSKQLFRERWSGDSWENHQSYLFK